MEKQWQGSLETVWSRKLEKPEKTATANLKRTWKIQLENLDFVCYLMGTTLKGLFGGYKDLPDKNIDSEWSMPVQGIRWPEDKRWTSSQEPRRFSQCNMKEGENKGNGGDNGQGQKSLLSWQDLAAHVHGGAGVWEREDSWHRGLTLTERSCSMNRWKPHFEEA